MSTNDGVPIPLQQNEKRGKLTVARKVIILSNIGRHLTAILFCIAELILGFKPERL